jgi:hypothetical protein
LLDDDWNELRDDVLVIHDPERSSNVNCWLAYIGRKPKRFKRPYELGPGIAEAQKVTADRAV